MDNLKCPHGVIRSDSTKCYQCDKETVPEVWMAVRADYSCAFVGTEKDMRARVSIGLSCGQTFYLGRATSSFTRTLSSLIEEKI